MNKKEDRKEPITKARKDKRYNTACIILQGLLSNPNTKERVDKAFGTVKGDKYDEILCKTAYRIADKMLELENE